jgi:glyceraldehyde-3-phosphate dehydrogenase (NADP+)
MSETIFSSLYKNTEQNIFYYFDGTTWKESTSGKTIAILSPIDNSVVGHIQAITKEEATESIERAAAAQPLWERIPLFVRTRALATAADLIRENVDTLTDLLVLEIGKPKGEAKGEVLRTADIIEYTAQESQSLHGEEIDSDHFPGFDKGRIALVDRVAHGVVLAIAPFNYPLNLAASKIAPALAMGNAVIFKPPTQGSISGLFLTQLFIKAGIPNDVLSCLTQEGREIGDSLVTHPAISMIAFTGSTKVGVSIAKAAGMIPLLFECGGNNPVIVLPDAEMDKTAVEIVRGAFSYAGQRCTGIRYVLATQDVLTVLVPKVVDAVKALTRMGDPRRDETKMIGPVISQQAAESIIQTVQEAVAAGAVVVTGGTKEGTFVPPTIVTNVVPTMKIVAEETFGPVLSFITVRDTEEAVAIINASKYGLQAALFTQDEGTGMVLARRLNVGTIQLNGSPQRGPDHFPFLGVKQSGVGVQGIRYSLIAMSRLRSVVVNKPQ